MMGINLEIILLVCLALTTGSTVLMTWYIRNLMKRMWAVRNLGVSIHEEISVYSEKLEELCGMHMYQKEPVLEELLSRSVDLRDSLDEWLDDADDVFSLSELEPSELEPQQGESLNDRRDT